MMEFLTDEDYTVAEKNGINKKTAYARCYYYGWTVEDTITKPLHKPNLWKKYQHEVEKIGITQTHFYYRIRKGMSPEQAATTPKQAHSSSKNPKLTPEIVARAKANGISKDTLAGRVYKGKWDIERAVTAPVRGWDE